jgi:hypothetical protein
VVIRVDDCGPGPDDPLAGLFAPDDPDGGSGRGLWITHQLDLDVALAADEHGFSVRIRTEAA